MVFSKPSVLNYMTAFTSGGVGLINLIISTNNGTANSGWFLC